MNDNLAVKAKKLTLLAKFFAESSLMLSSGIDEYSTDAKLIEFEKDKDRLINLVTEVFDITKARGLGEKR